jgi:hypothetical protein
VVRNAVAYKNVTDDRCANQGKCGPESADTQVRLKIAPYQIEACDLEGNACMATEAPNVRR